MPKKDKKNQLKGACYKIIINMYGASNNNYDYF